MKILIVDDCKDTGESLKMALDLRGHEVTWLQQSSIAEARLCTFRDGQLEPADAAVVDYLMPGMNGVELIERVRATVGRETLAVVLVTGMDLDRLTDLHTRLEGLGPIALLRKPFAPLELLEVIESLRAKSCLPH